MILGCAWRGPKKSKEEGALKEEYRVHGRKGRRIARYGARSEAVK